MFPISCDIILIICIYGGYFVYNINIFLICCRLYVLCTLRLEYGFINFARYVGVL